MLQEPEDPQVVVQMIILCVDGIDPDLVQEFGWGKLFKYNYSLSIPPECYVPDKELGSTPHTTRVWPTIFSGQIIDYGLTRRSGARKKIHDALVRMGITWKRGKPKFRVAPTNRDLETIFDDFHSFTWNLPTMDPEWLATFPSYEAFVEHCKRELWMFMLMTRGAVNSVFPLNAFYVRYVDFIGHNEPEKLRGAYDNIFQHASELKKKEDVILLSDHGCDAGLHTEQAYFGSDYPIHAESVHELRDELERIFIEVGLDYWEAPQDFKPEEEDLIKERLRRLGYIE